MTFSVRTDFSVVHSPIVKSWIDVLGTGSTRRMVVANILEYISLRHRWKKPEIEGNGFFESKTIREQKRF